MKKVTTRLNLESLGDRIVPSLTSSRPENPGVSNAIFIDDGTTDTSLDLTNPPLDGYEATALYSSTDPGSRASGVSNAIFIDDGTFDGSVDVSNPPSDGDASTSFYGFAESGQRGSGVVNAIFIDDGSFDGSIDTSNPALGGFVGTTMYVAEDNGLSNSQRRSLWGTYWDEIYDGLGRTARGFGKAAVELGQMGRDVGNTGLSLGSQGVDLVFDTGLYDYDLHSQLFGGYSKARYENQSSSPGNYQSPQAAEIQFRAMRGVITLGLYDLASSGVEADATGNYNRFQEDSGGFLFGAVLPYAPGAARSVGRAGVNLGREAGPFLNPGNYRLNPNSLQSFPSVPLEFRGPTFTRPSGAGPVPFGLEGPTVIQSPTLSGPVTVTGPVAAGSPALTPGAGIAGGTRVVPPAGGTPQRGTFRVIEVDRNVMDLEIMTDDGKIINVMTDFEVQGDKLILKQFHVGERLRRGDIGPRELKDSLEAFAQEIGRQYGVKSVRIEGGIRKAGTDNPRYPRPIEIEVK